MKCPFCGYLDSRVLESRATDEMSAIRRRRECPRCGRRFTTYERVEESPLLVVKKDGSRESFSRQKILSGMLKACEKRPIPLEILERASFEVERELRETGKGEVTSKEIGELVMEKLKQIDDVAYVRFASVYREFRDLDGFREEVERILAEKGRAVR
ncbi:MAG: transcriptional repressor NrdR [Candidatus Fermentithermobacillus carboniphilus]|uniref:Transcriptional repressor NrdR n=1 Tax=Candidatus Fermentithermobacillus carboniphilus TaxID=3085328 RepID=A0AAT9LEE1_9FIRM|nr:MAG: transcriptional repressor NrdR [Candidatus Fermentithermobacillus carboniphilus]